MTFNNSPVPYLRRTRKFPSDDINRLTLELDKSYIDIANAVNSRTLGIFPTNVQVATGEQWFINVNINSNSRQQTIRQVFTFTSTTTINHSINIIAPNQFVRCFGSYIDNSGTNAYGLFWTTNVPIAGQITFFVTTTQIIFNVGGGAPALQSGIIVLEWFSQP